ncbi:hypothetical protein Tco_0680439 [Tanacetum coccineum]|uniref:RNA polymerase alpha subunit n=1 Tax=Tanacetum coccineum TaxID=301880 RepID=A0ABQ4XLZ8_9ASTR
MIGIFGLLKELTSRTTLEKVLVREEIRNPTTKNVNTISLCRIENEKIKENNKVIDKNIIEQEKRNIKEPIRITKVRWSVRITIHFPKNLCTRLTDEKLIETDIRLSLASQSHIYPLGIAEDVLVEIAGFVYPVDFLILDIKEDRKSHPS